MAKEERCHKAFVRKHRPSYWEEWFGKKKKDHKNNDNDRDYNDTKTPQNMRSAPSSNRATAGITQEESMPFAQNPNQNFPQAQQQGFGGAAGAQRFPGQSARGFAPSSRRPTGNPELVFQPRGGTAFSQPSSNRATAGGWVPPSVRRDLGPGELNEHLRKGGMTNAGERARGVEGPTVYGGGSMRAERGSRARGRTSVEEHPWYPRTEVFEGEKTRR